MGRQAEEIVAKGDLLPDEFMLRVVASKLDQLRDKHWILDGFPRTIGQGELLDTHLRYVADAYSVRRICSPCPLLLYCQKQILLSSGSHAYTHHIHIAPTSGRQTPRSRSSSTSSSPPPSSAHASPTGGCTRRPGGCTTRRSTRRACRGATT